MRILRALTIAASVVALPSLATAQQGRPFKDAWFWGVKAGGLSVADTGGSYSFAPMVGAEWLITRTHGGLYISAGQAFFILRRSPRRAESRRHPSRHQAQQHAEARRGDHGVPG